MSTRRRPLSNPIAEWRQQNARFRFQWMEAVLAARDLTLAEKVLAERIALHRNDETLRCFPSEATLAAGTSLTPRAVRKAKRALQQGRWIDWKKNVGGVKQGYGITNEYRLMADKVPGAVDRVDEMQATRNRGSGLVGELPGTAKQASWNGEESYPEQRSKLPGTGVPPNLNLNLNANHNGNLEGAGAREHEGVVEKKMATNEELWQRVTEELREKIGGEAFAVIERTALDRITGRTGNRTVWLAAGGPSEAESIQRDIGHQLLKCWQAVVPTVTSVRVLTTGLDAAPSRRAAAAGQ
jgi:hypothetical protein